jgi:hypothetical protein
MARSGVFSVPAAKICEALSAAATAWQIFGQRERAALGHLQYPVIE